jgi:hypothetical protein
MQQIEPKYLPLKIMITWSASPIRFMKPEIRSPEHRALLSRGGYSIHGTATCDFDGPLAPISCVSQTAYERCSCPDEEHCGLRMLMLDVRSAIANILDHYTLADVVEVTLRKLRKSEMPLPFSLEQLVESRSYVKKPKKCDGHSK